MDGLRVFILTGSPNGSTTGSATGSDTIVASDLAPTLAIGLGPITSGGVVALFRSVKDLSIVSLSCCGVNGSDHQHMQ